MAAREYLVEGHLLHAHISLLAGDVYDSRRVRRKLHLFKGVYAIASLLNLRRLVGDLRYRRRQARVEFTGGNTAQDRH